MHASRFDALTRALAASTRRHTTRRPSPTGQAGKTPHSVPADLQGRVPGSLVASEEITATDDPDFPPGARAWRVTYVSTGRDNTEKTLVRGIVVAPADLAMLSRDRSGHSGRMVAWTHGTLGVIPRCQPSANPALEIWGPPPFGINTVNWGSETRGDAHAGKPEDGMLAGMIARGWVVTATDYAGGIGDDRLQPFVIGKIEAANAVDNLRVAHQLLASLESTLPDTWETVVWGHSQGGHAALWTGQLLEAYDEATRTPDGPTFRLAGVVAEAPASNILVTPDAQGAGAIGFGLFDWVAHTELQLTGQPAAMPIAPFFFSYVLGAWADHASGPLPANDQMPAFPASGPLDPSAILTP
ncbi:MAG: lipase family protein, partial [Thermomicrobiales bacterium]